VRESIWIFGYGSLVWRPAFPHARRQPAFVRGWTRRFWQGSTDHRGVPEAPGRVVTLVPDEHAHCWGMAYQVAGADLDDVLAQLDHREKGGYERRVAPLNFAEAAEAAESAEALLYIATSENENYLGPAPLTQIADQVRRSVGPSGPNIEYVIRLAGALREMGADDPHVFELADLLRTD